jgi:hypothetical protein
MILSVIASFASCAVPPLIPLTFAIYDNASPFSLKNFSMLSLSIINLSTLLSVSDDESL